MKKKRLLEKIDHLFEAEYTDFPTYLEIEPHVWNKLQDIARQKNYNLTDIELRSEDNKILVDMETDDAWNQILTYLDLDDLKGKPIRDLTIDDLKRTVTSPEASQNSVTISGTLGDEDLTTDDEVAEIIDANLKVNKAELQGSPDITKAGNQFAIRFNFTKPDEIELDDIKRNNTQNLDKIFNITDVEVK